MIQKAGAASEQPENTWRGVTSSPKQELLTLKFPRASRAAFFVFCQAGIIEEMLEDTFEGLEDQEEMEEEAEMEIDKILFEITAGEFVFAESGAPALVSKMQQLKPLSVLTWLRPPRGVSAFASGQSALTNWFLRECWPGRPLSEVKPCAAADVAAALSLRLLQIGVCTVDPLHKVTSL